MAVFRIEKTRDYTIMSNHHLRNESLTLKAKGLLSQMLSLPESWDFTLTGLSQINRESVDAIRTAVWELERAGYITRQQGRDDKGKMSAIVYTIYEQPQAPVAPQPDPEDPACSSPYEPVLDYPTSDNPTSDNPTSENPTQLNKDILSIEISNTDLLSKESVPFSSPPARVGWMERNGTEAVPKSTVDYYWEIILRNIEYDHMIERYPRDRARIREIAELMLETLCSARETLCIAGDDYPTGLVKEKLLRIKGEHLEFVLDCLEKNTTEIRNIKKYLLAVLFNASSTIDSYYTAQVAHDMASGDVFGNNK